MPVPRHRIPLAAVTGARKDGGVSVTATIADSVRRPFGILYRVRVEIACGGFRFALVDEIGRHLSDFDLLHPSPEPIDAIVAESGEVVAADQVARLCVDIVGAHRPLIRDTLTKLIPALAQG
jgi:hypothetical protein